MERIRLFSNSVTARQVDVHVLVLFCVSVVAIIFEISVHNRLMKSIFDLSFVQLKEKIEENHKQDCFEVQSISENEAGWRKRTTDRDCWNLIPPILTIVISRVNREV